MGVGTGTRNPHPGMGHYAHRDGYNVLYGDWSAKWYGDPQQGIVYWTGRINDSGIIAPYQETVLGAMSGAYGYGKSLAVNGIMNGTDAGSSGTGWEVKPGTRDLSGKRYNENSVYYEDDALTVWHTFDMANGMDVDGKEPKDKFGNYPPK